METLRQFFRKKQFFVNNNLFTIHDIPDSDDIDKNIQDFYVIISRKLRSHGKFKTLGHPDQNGGVDNSQNVSNFFKKNNLIC